MAAIKRQGRRAESRSGRNPRRLHCRSEKPTAQSEKPSQPNAQGQPVIYPSDSCARTSVTVPIPLDCAAPLCNAATVPIRDTLPNRLGGRPFRATECSETAPPSPQSGPAPPDAGTVCGHRPRPPPETVPRRRVRYDTAGAVKSRLLAACHTKQTPFCSIFHKGKNLSPSPKQKASAAPDLPQKADAVLPRLNKADFRQPYPS